jgi:hypothetical protein
MVTAINALTIGALAFQVVPQQPLHKRGQPPTMAMPWEKDGPDVKSLVQVTDITVGSGEEASKGCKICFDFASRVVDGAELSSDQNIKFELGKVDVIPGWAEGLSGMRVGGVRKVTLPEELWKDAQPSAIKDVPRGEGALIEFDFTMKEVTPKSFFDVIGIPPTKTNAVLAALILLIGVWEGYQALVA